MVKNMAIKIGIVGAGRWGNHLIRNFLAAEQARVVAIADPSPTMLQRTQENFSLDPTVVLTSSWQTLLAQPGLEAIVVATPAVTHFEIIEAALRQGCHVLAEKPLTLTSDSSQALWDLAQQQRVLMVDHTYLFHPAVQWGQAFLQGVLPDAPRLPSSPESFSGPVQANPEAIGQLHYGYASRTHLGPVRQDVDALWDLAIHDIAIFNHWLGMAPQAVQAQGQGWLQPQQCTPLSPQGLGDQVWATLAYGNGLQVGLHFCWANPDKQRRLALVGDRGTLIFDELSSTPLVVKRGWFQATDSHPFVPTGQETLNLEIPPGEPLQQMCHHFLDCVAQQQNSSVSDGQVGTDLVRILEGLSHSLNQGNQWIKLD
jgi:predicted dehydrogenase